MAQEFTINSSAIESKINQLLPSQGNRGAGVDFSASTMIIPIIDLTESAEGSNVRADLQSALFIKGITAFSVINATNTVLITTPGYFRVFGSVYSFSTNTINFNLFDGTTAKSLIEYNAPQGQTNYDQNYDFIVFIGAGDSLRATANSTNSALRGNTRQIADIAGTLVIPT